MTHDKREDALDPRFGPPRAVRACGDCTFWERPADGSPIGECRRYAPRPHAPRVSSSIQVQAPKTAPDYWCGEWRAEL